MMLTALSVWNDFLSPFIFLGIRNGHYLQDYSHFKECILGIGSTNGRDANCALPILIVYISYSAISLRVPLPGPKGITPKELTTLRQEINP